MTALTLNRFSEAEAGAGEVGTRLAVAATAEAVRRDLVAVALAVPADLVTLRVEVDLAALPRLLIDVPAARAVVPALAEVVVTVLVAVFLVEAFLVEALGAALLAAFPVLARSEAAGRVVFVALGEGLAVAAVEREEAARLTVVRVELLACVDGLVRAGDEALVLEVDREDFVLCFLATSALHA